MSTIKGVRKTVYDPSGRAQGSLCCVFFGASRANRPKTDVVCEAYEEGDQGYINIFIPEPIMFLWCFNDMFYTWLTEKKAP